MCSFWFQFEEATGSLPDPNQPLAHQLDHALSKIKEHVRTILEIQATCKTLEEVKCSEVKGKVHIKTQET